MSRQLWQSGFKLSPLTSMRLGGPARYFHEFADSQDLIDQLKVARREKCDIFIIGGGSNIVVSDHGLDALVLKSAACDIRIEQSSNETAIVNAEAGASWDKLVSFAIDHGLSGIETLSGIPGTVGAAPIQNIGAYGQEVSETFLSLEALNVQDLRMVRFDRAACQFSYRNSRFKPRSLINPEWIILSVRLQLNKSGPDQIRYPELNEFLNTSRPKWQSETIPIQLKLIRNAVMQIRSRKSMVIDVNNPNARSCGSFFTNPIVEALEAERIQRSVAEQNLPPIPQFGAEGGKIKLSAARIVEISGFARGFVHGAAGVSSDHALALIAHDERAQDVYELAKMIQQQALKKFGIRLETEPAFIGKF